MPKVGIEPTLPEGNRILSPARLPVPPLRPAVGIVARRCVAGAILPAHVSMRTTPLALLAARSRRSRSSRAAAAAAADERRGRRPRRSLPRRGARPRGAAGWQRLAKQDRRAGLLPVVAAAAARPGRSAARARRQYVEPDRSYLVAFFWLETTPTGGEEVHVNLRGYPGQDDDPDLRGHADGRRQDVAPEDARASTTRAVTSASGRRRRRVYTANQGADQWHVLYAWRHRGSLYTVSEHVAPPFSYPQVVANLNRMMRGLVLAEAARRG